MSNPIRAEVDASALVAFYDSKVPRIVQGLISVSVSVSQRIAADLRSRIIRPRRINVQDADGRPGIGKNPVSVETGADFAQVVLRPHWTVARSNSLAAVANRTGSGLPFEREGLWVSRNVGRSTSRGYTSRSGLVFKSFSSNAKLEEWARRRDRGMQILRHAIYVGRPEVLKTLIVQPAVSRAMPALQSQSIQAVREA